MSSINETVITAQELATRAGDALEQPPASVPTIEMEEGRQRNARNCMATFLNHRLASVGESPEHLKHSNYRWHGGNIVVKNARIHDYHWSVLQENTVERVHQEAQSTATIYIFTNWSVDDKVAHIWIVPEAEVYLFSREMPAGKDGLSKTLLIDPVAQDVKNAPNAPDMSQFYMKLDLLPDEVNQLAAAIKVDTSAKSSDNKAGSDDSDDTDETPAPVYTEETVAFIRELVDRTEDGEWHKANKKRFQRVLREPTLELANRIRDEYVQRLSPEVASVKRLLSILKKNDYGKGGYHDHFWFAFYDPNAGSKIKSVQLFFSLDGGDDSWYFGLSMGDHCPDYIERLQATVRQHSDSFVKFLRQAPNEVLVRVKVNGDEHRLSTKEFTDKISSGSIDLLSPESKLEDFDIIRKYQLETLPELADGVVGEVGAFFTWVWPLFEASMTGDWVDATPPISEGEPTNRGEVDVDEEAPSTLQELSQRTALSEEFLEELEDSLLAKNQVILVGPPGTSKTYIAQQFARYFVRETNKRPQGKHSILYMHANWTYEDFFEGIKPATSEQGTLTFRSQKGFFLDWVELLKDFETSARHVLVLDEINRCDTAAVLGELLQLLEYRGTTIRLLSGRPFAFPRNLYIIGTMNSADRSIGRMDLALRRRFLWLNLHPQPETLQRWLDRPGNNTSGFHSDALSECNQLLLQKGIPPEQHIGHALFMMHQTSSDDDPDDGNDLTLLPAHLKRIVRFSVEPYVRELFATQFGQVDEEFVRIISVKLLGCLNHDGQ